MTDRITIERATGEEFAIENSSGQLIKLTGWKATLAGWGLGLLGAWIVFAAIVGSVVIVQWLVRLLP
jgi:hypothetical protein